MTLEPNRIPLIVIAGRPNVGKSTLFNRLTGRWSSIVEDQPGITRDRLYGEFQIFDQKFRIMDTGGLSLKPQNDLEQKMSEQARLGIEEADLILFLLDGRSGLLPEDEEWMRQFRKIKKPKIFLVNKLDTPKLDGQLQDFYKLGVSPLVPISTETQRNFSGLNEAIVNHFKTVGYQAPEEAVLNDDDFSIAIIGRPNVGKSTLLNALLHQNRSIVDDAPGTTRDAIHTYLKREDKSYCIIDTAGIRKRAKSTERVEIFSIMQARQVIDRANLVLLVIDGSLGPANQDAVVAGYAFQKQKALIIIVNKWDEGSKKMAREDIENQLELRMSYLSYCPRLYISAKTGKNVDKIFTAIETLRTQYETEIKTSELNKAFQYIVDHHPLPVHQGKSIKMFYITQVGNKPPSFAIFCSYPEKVHFSYKRYLLNALKEIFKLDQTPLRLLFKKR